MLARGSALAYPPFGTVTVLIDGVPAGTPGGWAARSDLTALFPSAGYAGRGHALGIAGIDTTQLANGLHTIAWIVTADNGQSQGIGSRFFTVDNISTPADGRDSKEHPAPRSSTRSTAAPEDRSAVIGRRGYDLSSPYRRFAPVGPDGRVDALR